MQSALAVHTLGRITHRRTWISNTALVLTGALVIAALAQVRIPLPFTPVPLTLQTLAVLLIGAVLGSRRGAAAVLAYLAGGILGLPFFAGGQAALLGPTGGYLLGFVLAAFIVGKLAERGLDRSIRTSLLPFLAGEFIILACGSLWLASFVGFSQAITLGVLPFLLGDALKALAAAALLPAAWKWVNRL